jgi:hypothetical protein
MKSLAIQTLVLAGTISLAFSKFSWGPCPIDKNNNDFTTDSKEWYEMYVGSNVLDSWAYEHRVI